MATCTATTDSTRFTLEMDAHEAKLLNRLLYSHVAGSASVPLASIQKALREADVGLASVNVTVNHHTLEILPDA